MRKSSLKFLGFLLLTVVIFNACKKVNPLNQTPKNVRLMNYTRTVLSINPGSIPYIENYRFTYNKVNQVDSIYFTTNQPGGQNYVSIFHYNDRVVTDTIKQLNGTILEIDTFITDYNRNIDTTYITGNKVAYTYYNNLITRIDHPNYTFSTFTSYNNNLTKQIFSTTTPEISYKYYTDMPFNTLDYLYIVSLSRYGMSMYHTANLVESISSVTDTTKVFYTLDADSKVVKMVVAKIDTFVTPTLGYTYHPLSDTETYYFQYQRY